MTAAAETEFVGCWFSSLKFRTGLEVDLTPGQLVLLIGPNSAGKSTLLRELLNALPARVTRNGLVLESAAVERTGSIAALRDWMKPQHTHKVDYRGVRTKVLFGSGGLVEERDFSTWQGPTISDALLRQLYTYITYKSRMKAVEPCKAFDPLEGIPEHPLQSLLSRPELAIRVNRVVERSFNVQIALDHAAGESLPAYCVPDFNSAPTTDRVSLEYLRWLRAHPPLHYEGDGLKSFVGCVFEALTNASFITLLDEPEVFLHPPQARSLGRTLAEEQRPDQQLFVATHSSDFLRGALEAKPRSVRVIRLSRGKGKADAASIAHDELAKLWSDPTLQYSNILDALFHDGVVLCEAEGDCRFYQWIAGTDPGTTERDDIMYLPTGGKDRIPSVLSSLRTLGLPCVAILDADAIRDKPKLSRLVTAAGGEWGDFLPLWEAVDAAAVRLGTTLTKSELQSQVKDIFARHDNKFVTETLADALKSVVRIESGWSLFKRSGLSALPSGTASKAAADLLSKLSELGLFVVPVGEMEGFLRSIGGHGPGWVSAVMEKFSPDDEELKSARIFVHRVLEKFSAPNATTKVSSIASGSRVPATRTTSRPGSMGVRRLREWGRVVREMAAAYVPSVFVFSIFVVAVLVAGVGLGVAIQKDSDRISTQRFASHKIDKATRFVIARAGQDVQRLHLEAFVDGLRVEIVDVAWASTEADTLGAADTGAVIVTLNQSHPDWSGSVVPPGHAFVGIASKDVSGTLTWTVGGNR